MVLKSNRKRTRSQRFPLRCHYVQQIRDVYIFHWFGEVHFEEMSVSKGIVHVRCQQIVVSIWILEVDLCTDEHPVHEAEVKDVLAGHHSVHLNVVDETVAILSEK